MRQTTLTEHESDDEQESDCVVCPACDYTSDTHKGFAIHYSKNDGEHTGNPTIARFGKERLINLYWEHGYEEIADILGVGSTTLCNAYDTLELPQKKKYNRVAWEHGVSLERVLYHLHHDAMMATPAIADALDVSRMPLAEWFQRVDVHKRSQSEAEQVKHDQMSDEELQAQTEAARKANYEKYGNGGYISQWVNDNPEEHAEIAHKNASKGTPAREENGMVGVTGQNHPTWRGGKHMVDALRKQLRPSWWTVRDDERADECYSCAATNCKLDVHHIVPLSAGGTNESWNLMTLCDSCHKTAENHTRSLPGMEPTLIE